MGQGLQRQPRGGNVMRAIAMLPALTGNIRRPGSGFLYLNGGESRGIDFDWLTGSDLAGPEGRPAISQMDLADVLADPDRSRALVCWNINPVASSPQQAALRTALARDDLLTVVCDLFLTDTAAFADYVLPAAGFLECDDILPSYFHHTLSAQVKAVDPPGRALRNSEIFRRLAAAMGFDEPELQESDAALVERLLERSGVAWDELARAGTVRLFPEPRVQFRRRLPDPERPRRDRVGRSRGRRGSPVCPSRAPTTPPPPGQLRLLSPSSPWLMNSTFGNDRKLRHRIGPASVALHPREAAGRGLRSGDAVTLRNATGALSLVVEISDAVPPGVAYSPKCRWPSHEAAGANVNALNPGRQDGHGGELGGARRARRARARVASPACARPAASSNRSLCRRATSTASPTRTSASPTGPATASRSRAARALAASRRCSRRRSASTCACTAPRRARACSC